MIGPHVHMGPIIIGQVKWMGGYKIMEGRSNVSKISVMIDATFTFLQLPD